MISVSTAICAGKRRPPAQGDEPQFQRFSDPHHPEMLGWKVDYALPEDAGNPVIELDYDFWAPKIWIRGSCLRYGLIKGVRS